MKNLSCFKQKINTVAFVCAAGMGTSVVGAAMLRKKLNNDQVEVDVHFSSVGEIPDDVDLIIAHVHFKEALKRLYPDQRLFFLDSYTDAKGYDRLMDVLKEHCHD
jgi:mannitol PTS system EIICBA or EIICB component